MLSWANRAKAVVRQYEDGRLTLDQAVIWHCKIVISPPMHEKQYASTIRAVHYAAQGQYDHPVHVPVTLRGQDRPTAQDIVVSCGLDFLVSAAQYKEPYGISYGKDKTNHGTEV